MRHAVLGFGGIGALLSGALARAGLDVVALLREPTLSEYRGTLRVESAVLGNFEAQVPAELRLDRPADVLWVATKATQLDAALASAPPEEVGAARVVPLLNGVDHVERLRSQYDRVVAATIRVESERVAPDLVRQTSPFLLLDVADDTVLADELRRAGLTCEVADDETTLLWSKLAFLAPIALATTAFRRPVGDIRSLPLFAGCRAEAVAVARADGALLEENAVVALHAALPASMRTSMQKDAERGRELELDAIAGPILRGGVAHNIPTPATQALAERIRG